MKLNLLKSTIFTLVLLSSFSPLFAQDTIIKKDGEKLKVIIKEVNNNDIKYVDFKDQDGVLFTIDKVLVKEVKFAHGKNLDVKNPEDNAYYFADDKISNFMFNFSAFGGNTLGLAYERVLKPGQSLMLEAKIYGIGIKPDYEDSRNGFGLALSYRLKTKSLFSPNSFRPKHILHGAYFAPVVGFSVGEITYKDHVIYDPINGSNLYNPEHSVVHFGLEYGKQWILQNKFSIDASLGFHYYFGADDSTDDGYSYQPIRLGNMSGGDNKLLSFNLRIGFLGGKSSVVKKP